MPKQTYSPLSAANNHTVQDPSFYHSGLFRINKRLYAEPIDEREGDPYKDKDGVRVSIPHSHVPANKTAKRVYPLKTRITFEPSERYVGDVF